MVMYTHSHTHTHTHAHTQHTHTNMHTHTHSHQLSEENTRLREQVSRVKGHLDMAHSQADREHQEDSNTLTILRDEMRALEAER